MAAPYNPDLVIPAAPTVVRYAGALMMSKPRIVFLSKRLGWRCAVVVNLNYVTDFVKCPRAGWGPTPSAAYSDWLAHNGLKRP